MTKTGFKKCKICRKLFKKDVKKRLINMCAECRLKRTGLRGLKHEHNNARHD